MDKRAFSHKPVVVKKKLNPKEKKQIIDTNSKEFLSKVEKFWKFKKIIKKKRSESLKWSGNLKLI